MMGLETIRQDINAVDRQLIALLEKRMVLADQVAVGSNDDEAY